MSRKLTVALLALAVLVAACQEPESTPSAGSNSNWLVSCELDEHCSGATSCVCTRCTVPCEADADCAALPGARCALPESAATASECGDATTGGLCLLSCEAGSCDGEQACVAGACVLDPAPESAFCASVATADAAARRREDELLTLVQAMREAGGVTCGASAASLPAPTLLRQRGSLRCAARVLATDVDAGSARGLVDASGRSTRARLAAAGYVDTLWAEAFAINAPSPTDALVRMLSDESSCLALTRDGYLDIGVGCTGQASVASLAAE
jgi:hypothetical protein